MRHFVSVLILLAVVCPQGKAHAQVAGELEAPLGATVRVTATRMHADRLRGTLLALEGDSLLLSIHDGRAQVTLRAADVDALEQSTGRARDRGAARGALIAVLGTGSAVLIREPGGVGEAGLGVIIGMPVVAAVGAAVGAYAAPERFAELYTRLGPPPQSRTGTLSLAILPDVNVRVRPRAGPTGVVRGRTVAAGADSIVVVRRGHLTRFATRDVAQVQVRGGRARRRGMLLGAVLGATIGAAAPAHAFAKLPAAANGPASTIALNAVIGSAFGLIFAPSGWVALPLPAGR